MQVLSTIAKKIVVFTEGIGPAVKNWVQRLQLKRWSEWVGGKSPMPGKSQRVALASTAAAALVVVVLLVVGASMVLQSPSHHAPKAAQSSTGSGSSDSDSSDGPDVSDFQSSDPTATPVPPLPPGQPVHRPKAATRTGNRKGLAPVRTLTNPGRAR